MSQWTLQGRPSWLIYRMGLRRQLFWSAVLGQYLEEGKRRGQKSPKAAAEAHGNSTSFRRAMQPRVLELLLSTPPQIPEPAQGPQPPALFLHLVKSAGLAQVEQRAAR